MATEPADQVRANDEDSPQGRSVGDLARRFLARADWPAGLLLALLATTLWLTLLPTAQGAVRLATPPPWFESAGFHSPEDNGSFSFRWSRPEAELTLPVTAAERYTITLTLADGPGAAAPRPLTVLIDGTPLATIYPDQALRDYRLDYRRPDGAKSATPLKVRLRTPAIAIAGDPRELGVVVALVRWGRAEPAPRRAALLIGQLALLGLAYAAQRATRRGRPVASPIAARPSSTPARRALGAAARQRRLLAPAALGAWALVPALLDPADPTAPLWGYVVILAVGVAALPRLHRRRPALAAAAYALAALLAAAWWHWAVAPGLVTLPQPYDQSAPRLVPWVLALFAAATGALAWLLPPERRLPILIGDLVAGLAAISFTAGGLLAARGGFTALEQDLRVSWPGALLILLIAAKTLPLGAALWRAAPGVTSERRMALAVLALCAATLWSLLPWRVATMGLSGDEPAYLAAALSLARDHDLDVDNNGYAPWMLARIHYPNDAWAHEVEDTTRDRFAAASAYPPARRHALPVVAGPGLRGEIAVANPGPAAASITVRVGGSGDPERFVLAPTASRPIAVPAAADWRDATVEADTPVAVAVRLVTATGALDGYGVAPPASRFCVPLPGTTGAVDALIFLRNDDNAPATPGVTRFDAAGRASDVGAPAVPAGATLALPLPEGATTRAICVAADRPLTAITLIGVTGSALLALPAPPATSEPLVVPPAPVATRQPGTVALVAYNPGDAPVRVRRAGIAQPLAAIPVHGTAQVALGGSSSSNRPSVILEADGPLVAYFLLTLDRHQAIVAPGNAAPAIWFPAIAGEARHFVATRVSVQNPGPATLPVAVTLFDDRGEARDRQQITLCGQCTASFRLDFAAPDGTLIEATGAVGVRADRPVIAAATQITAQGSGFYHSWGLPALLAPGVLLFGVPGALLIVSGCGALLAMQLYGLLRDSGSTRRIALAATLALGLAVPVLPFALMAYPEIPAALLLVTGLRLALAERPARPAETRSLPRWVPGGWLVAVLACALAVSLLHSRLLPLAALLAICGGWRAVGPLAFARRAWRNLLLASALPLGLVALWWLAGPWLPAPLALSSRLSAASLARYFAPSSFGHHLAGIALDRATGILPVAPLLLLAPLGLIALALRAPRYAVWGGGLVALQFALVALRADGWEVWGPPGRYVLPVIPLLGLGVAGAWSDPLPRLLRFVGAALAAWGWAVAACYAWIPHAAYYLLPERRWLGDLLLHAWGWPNPLRLFPAINAGLPFDPAVVVPWVLFALGIVAGGVRWRALVARGRTPAAK